MLQRYEAYKESGVEWLGEIPEGWEVKRLAVFGRFSKGGGFSKSDLRTEGVSAILYGDIYTQYDFSVKSPIRRISLDVAGNAMKLKENDILFTGSGETKEDIGKCIVFRGCKQVVAGGDIIIFRQIGNDPMFLTYALNTHGISEEKAKSSKGEIIVHTYASKLRELRIPLPPLPEQTAIANFLDDKTAKIDELVGIKRRQIALLRERKQILIQNAVTKGLNPDAPMKESGIDWIGEIPAHWEVKRSKYVFKQRKELAQSGDVQLSATQAYGVIPQEEYEKRVSRKVVKIQFNLEKRKHVEVDDFVISMRSFQGGLERARASGCIRSSYVVLRPNVEVIPLFFGYVLKSPRYIRAIQSTASFIRDGQDLNFGNFSKVDLFIPSRQEQQKIANYIEENVKKINTAIKIKQSQIEKLNEYKTTLINAAVTGKIKVV